MTLARTVAVRDLPTLASDAGALGRGAEQRRINVIWGFLFFNAMTWLKLGVPLPLPQRVAQLLTNAALVIALVLALSLNRRLVVRPVTVLSIYTVLLGLAFVSSLRLLSGYGSLFRCYRLTAFLAVCWLLSPYWGREDRPLLRAHLAMLRFVCGSVLVGMLLFPTYALNGYGGDGRLIGVLWPITPPQVGMYAAMLVGISLLLWLGGEMSRRAALVSIGLGSAMVLLSQTRTAMSGLLVATLVAAGTLLPSRRRVRRVGLWFLGALPVLVAIGAVVAPLWFTRGQSQQDLTELTGRTKVWTLLLAEPRRGATEWIGVGLTDKSFAGLSIDNTWLSVFHDLGKVGVGLIALVLVAIAITAVLRTPSTGRAVAVFLVTYVTVASVTEVTAGDASTYLLHLLVASSLLAAPLDAALPSWAPGRARVAAPGGLLPVLRGVRG